MPNPEPITPETLRGIACEYDQGECPDCGAMAVFRAAATEIEVLRRALELAMGPGVGSMSMGDMLGNVFDNGPTEEERAAKRAEIIEACIAAARAEIAKEKDEQKPQDDPSAHVVCALCDGIRGYWTQDITKRNAPLVWTPCECVRAPLERSSTE